MVAALDDACLDSLIQILVAILDFACIYTRQSAFLSSVLGQHYSAVFGDYIEQLLHHCRPFPEPNSVLVMDNAHRTDRTDACSSRRQAFILTAVLAGPQTDQRVLCGT